MRKILVVFLPIVFIGLLFISIQFFLSKSAGKGALQVTSQPKSSVYLNGKLLGQTPLCKCEPLEMLPVGEYTLKVIPTSSSQDAGSVDSFEKKITIRKSILTVVDRTFNTGASSEGSIITLSPLAQPQEAQILILSFPEKADVFLDNSIVGFTPILLKKVTPSDHELKLTKAGYKDKLIRIKTTQGYKLETLVFLGISADTSSSQASSSADVKTSPTPTPQKILVLILQTPTGFLRVRNLPLVTSEEVARVIPGNTYEFLAEENGWFQIKLLDGKIGWVSTSYAQKQ